MAEPKWEYSEYDLIFNAVQNLEPYTDVSAYLAPKWNDTKWDLLYKLTNNIGNISGGGGSATIPTPSSPTDFSGLPGGVAPAGGTDLIYFAIRDAFTYWTIGSGDTEWRVINKDSLP